MYWRGNYDALAASTSSRVLGTVYQLPRLYARLPAQFLFFPDAAFCSFTLCILHHFLFFAEPLVCFFHGTLLSLRLLKWG
jgi:hypothetical protein